MQNVIILGSGRSGTSMLTGSLSKAGYFLGKNFNYLGINDANPKGFFEDLEINTINEDILKLSLPLLPEIFRRRFFPSYTFYRARWLARLPLNSIVRSNNNINRRIEKIMVNTPFCFKDPRFCYTLPVWEKFLPQNTKFIVIYRDPYKTADSINRECRENLSLHPLKMNEKIALEVWKLMYSNILQNYQRIRKKEDWLFIHYDQMFSVSKISTVQKLLNIEIDNNFAEKYLSRSASKAGRIPPDLKKIYEDLNDLSGNQKSLDI